MNVILFPGTIHMRRPMNVRIILLHSRTSLMLTFCALCTRFQRKRCNGQQSLFCNMVKNWTQVAGHSKLHSDCSSCTNAKHLPFHFETNRAKLIHNRKTRTRKCLGESFCRWLCKWQNKQEIHKEYYYLLIAVPSHWQTQTPHNSLKCCWEVLWLRSQVLTLEIVHILQNRWLLRTLKFETGTVNMICMFIAM